MTKAENGVRVGCTAGIAQRCRGLQSITLTALGVVELKAQTSRQTKEAHQDGDKARALGDVRIRREAMPLDHMTTSLSSSLSDPLRPSSPSDRAELTPTTTPCSLRPCTSISVLKRSVVDIGYEAARNPPAATSARSQVRVNLISTLDGPVYPMTLPSADSVAGGACSNKACSPTMRALLTGNCGFVLPVHACC